MLKCEDIRGRLTLYLDNELQGEERGMVEAHLSDCESCAALFTRELNFLNAVRESAPLHVAPPELRAKVQKIVSEGGAVARNRPRRASRVSWLVATAAALLLLLLPLLVLGFSTSAVNAYVILVGLQAVLAHANLGIRFGVLEYLLVLPRYHHWHHARHKDYLDVNYAIHLPLVDMLMGTFKLPRKQEEWPEEYGVMKLETVPRGILRQHAMPFLGKKKYDDYVA